MMMLLRADPLLLILPGAFPTQQVRSLQKGVGGVRATGEQELQVFGNEKGKQQTNEGENWRIFIRMSLLFSFINELSKRLKSIQLPEMMLYKVKLQLCSVYLWRDFVEVLSLLAMHNAYIYIYVVLKMIDI